jgi:hypothetical protein
MEMASQKDEMRAYKKLMKAFPGYENQLTSDLSSWEPSDRVYHAYTSKDEGYTTIDKKIIDPIEAVNYLIEKAEKKEENADTTT